MATPVMWFRRDLRLADNPALRAAVDEGGDGVVPLYVLDPALWDSAPAVRQAYLAASLRDLSERLGPTGLHVVRGRPAEVVPRVVRKVGATSVHVAGEATPYGRRRDEAVTDALAQLPGDDVAWRVTGSAYAVAPGHVLKDDGEGYGVFTPFYRRWREIGWPAPAPAVRNVDWLDPGGRTHRIPDVSLPDGVRLPPAGETAARRRWREFLDDVDRYDEERDRPDLDTTSRMSVYLRWGELHPRTLLADLAPRRSKGAESYARELAFREFYADVLGRRPDSAWGYYDDRFTRMDYDRPGSDLEAWKQGRTGFPMVDAGMRQLLAEGWMHNRVRMIVASFLVKDLHLEWQHGARHFAERLVDFDLASNQHNWQWTAGCGTDAAPYFRVYNPVTQGKKFDPDGRYVRRWVPELADVADRYVHEPWAADEPPADYPAPLLDHAEERREALRRYDTVKGG